MFNRILLDALDRSLRDLMELGDIPFGGKVIVLAGDFRQVLPVVKGGSRAQIVNAALNRSELWKYFKVW